MKFEFNKEALQEMSINDLKGMKEDLEDLNRMSHNEKDSLILEIIALAPENK